MNSDTKTRDTKTKDTKAGDTKAGQRAAPTGDERGSDAPGGPAAGSPGPAGRTPPASKRNASLIHVSLGEPTDPAAGSVEAASTSISPDSGSGTVSALHAAPGEAAAPIDRAALRERNPDIDLGERRRRPRAPRDPLFVPPSPLPEGDLHARRHLIDEEEQQIDAADEQRFHEQSLAFARSSTDDETSDLTATSLKTDRDIVYRDMGGHDLSASTDAYDDTDASSTLASERGMSNTEGFFTRVYERLAGLLRRIPRWFGIRDEREGG